MSWKIKGRSTGRFKGKVQTNCRGTAASHTNAVISYLKVEFIIEKVASERVREIQDCGDDHTGDKRKKEKSNVLWSAHGQPAKI